MAALPSRTGILPVSIIQKSETAATAVLRQNQRRRFGGARVYDPQRFELPAGCCGSQSRAPFLPAVIPFAAFAFFARRICVHLWLKEGSARPLTTSYEIVTLNPEILVARTFGVGYFPTVS